MKTATEMSGLVARAAEALKALLREISSVKLTELQCRQPGRTRSAAIVVRIDVFGRSHTLECEVKPSGNPQQLMATLREWRESADRRYAGSKLVIIAPYLSPEAQALCKDSNAGFLDLEGNARIDIDEIFISKRTLLPRNMPRMQECAAIEPMLIEGAKARPPAPMVFIASNIPGKPARVREDAAPGIAVA